MYRSSFKKQNLLVMPSDVFETITKMLYSEKLIALPGSICGISSLLEGSKCFPFISFLYFPMQQTKESLDNPFCSY